MSDSKKTGGDAAADPTPAITPEEVKVKVRPQQQDLPKKGDAKRPPIEEQNRTNQRHADKATEHATKDVRDAIRQAAPAGREAQKQAAEKAAKDVGSKLPPRVFKDVQVDIPGEAPISAPATEGRPPDPPKK